MYEPHRRARCFLQTLLLAEVALGLTIIVFTTIIYYRLAPFMANDERSTLYNQYFNTMFIGFQLMVVYAASIPMWSRIWQWRCTNRIRLLLNVWMLFCFLMVIYSFASMWMMFTYSCEMEKLVELQLYNGINRYYACPEYKLLWDSLQYHRECCGVMGFRDWSKAQWMPLEEVRENHTTGRKIVTVLAPYTCCKHNCGSCYQSYEPGTMGAADKNIGAVYRRGSRSDGDLQLSQINTSGCLVQFSDLVWLANYWLLGLVLVAFKINLIISCMTKCIVRRQPALELLHVGCKMGYADEEGRPLVVVNCPPSVRCVTCDNEDSSGCHHNDYQQCGACSSKNLRHLGGREFYKAQQEHILR